MTQRIAILVASIFTFGCTLTAANAAARAPDDQQTDQLFIQSCLPLVATHWQRHGFHNDYTATHILYAQTGPDFFSEWADGSRSRLDYRVAVAFIRRDGRYDLADLLCHIDHNGKNSIDPKTPEPITAGVKRDIERIAIIQLPGHSMRSWVDASLPVDTVWRAAPPPPTPQNCEQARIKAQYFCEKISTPFSDGTPAGCNHRDCKFDMYSYCMRDQMSNAGCSP